MSKKRGIPVHVVEYHNEALSHIYRAIGSKYLSFQDLTLLHFDAHPDLGIPSDFQASDIYKKEVLMESLQIENWILPAVYAGHINKIVWFKPVWASQIPDGKYEFFVGKDPTTGTIRVSSTLSYFTTDCLYLDDGLMVEKKRVILHVITTNTPTSEQITISDFLHQGQSYLLDIDLDFFSTCNPFREMFSKEDLATLTQLYWFYPPKSNSTEDLYSCQRSRSEQLKTLRRWITQIERGETSADRNFHRLRNVFHNYKDSLAREIDEDDIEIFHGAGCATDEPELPHHVSSEGEVVQLVQAVERILSSIAVSPAMVTIARSTEDGYCPREQVDWIQVRVEDMLTGKYGLMTCHKHYQTDLTLE